VCTCIHRGKCSYVYEYLRLYCVTSEKTHTQLPLSLKPKATLEVLNRNSIFFKTLKNLYTTLKHLTEIEYQPHMVEIRIFGLFSS
jgi:hypothetical protein